MQGGGNEQRTAKCVRPLPLFFAGSHSPWHRPTNENTHRVIQEYLAKVTKIPQRRPHLAATTPSSGLLPIQYPLAPPCISAPKTTEMNAQKLLDSPVFRV